MRNLGIATAIAAVLAGCASAQLNFNALDLASTSSRLVTLQVLSNLAKFRSSPFATASQVSIPSGSVTTTNSITPTLGGALGTQATTSLATTVAATVSNLTTNTHVRPNDTIGLSASDQYSQNYTITPLQDPAQLGRLRALYRFGAHQGDSTRLLCEYPLVQKEGGSGTPSNSVSVYVSGGNAKSESPKDEKQRTKYERGATCGPNDVEGDLDTPDPEFLKPPGCVICDYQAPKGLSFTGRLDKTKIITVVTGIDSLQNHLAGASITGDCIPPSTTITSVDGNAKPDSEIHIHINKNSTCDRTVDLKVPSKKKENIQFSGDTKKDDNVITNVKGIVGVPKNLLGGPVSGLCIPFSTTITGMDKDGTIHISNRSTCDGPGKFEGPPAQNDTEAHVLRVNKLLRNDWIAFRDHEPGQPSAYVDDTHVVEDQDTPLSDFKDYPIYLKRGKQKEYSDFILFVLEATLQSTSAGGGASGKGTSQKGGSPGLVQLPARETVIE